VGSLVCPLGQRFWSAEYRSGARESRANRWRKTPDFHRDQPNSPILDAQKYSTQVGSRRKFPACNEIPSRNFLGTTELNPVRRRPTSFARQFVEKHDVWFFGDMPSCPQPRASRDLPMQMVTIVRLGFGRFAWRTVCGFDHWVKAS
jgi:hypothetical protein